MKLVLASASGKAKQKECAALADEYVRRAAAYLPTELQVYASSEKLLAGVAGKAGGARLVMLDPAGKLVRSEEFAELTERAALDSVRQLVFAIGPPDGWTDAERAQAFAVVSLGRITLPHELALAVAAEQMYRGLTIRAGHPYHGGH